MTDATGAGMHAADSPAKVETFSFPKFILAPYVATPPDVVRRMLALAQLGAGDFVYDIGCGDGRVIIEAARLHQASGVGIDIEPYWIEQSKQNAASAGVSERVRFELRDGMSADLSEATVIFMYLVHWSTQKLAQLILANARPGTRIVSHSFPIEAWVPEQIDSFIDAGGSPRTLYLWRLA